MKKIIPAAIIFIVLLISSAKSFSPGCYGFFSINSRDLYRYHDYGSSVDTINIDTTYNYGAVINDTLVYEESGIHCTSCSRYTVIVFNDTGFYNINFTTCLNTAITLNFHVMKASSPLSVSSISNPNILQIYPNPTNNTITIKDIPADETSLLQIINSIGDVVCSEKLFGKKEYLIDANFAKGIYFVKLSDGELNVVKKLVVE